MKRAIGGLVVIITGMTAAGCGTAIEYTELNAPPGPMAPRAASSVEVFTTAVPSRPFVEVGMIESQQESGWSTDGMGDIVQAMREHAAERGCDALILRGANDAVVGHASNGQGHVGTLKGYRGACVVYTGEAAAPAPAAQAAAAPAAPADAAPAAPAPDAAKTAPPAPTP